MAFHRTEWGERLWSWVMRLITWLPGKEKPTTRAPEIDAYQSAMSTDFNRFHERLFPQFFKKIQVETFTLAPLAALSSDAAIVYVAPTIGQLEYNYFNYLYTQHHLPLPQLANGLSLFFWLPWGDCKRQARLYMESSQATGHPDSAIRKGLWQKLIENGTPTLIRLKTSRLHDDLYWDDPQEDPLAAVIRAAQANTRPVFCIPQDFIWDKHPDRPPNALTLFLIGDRDKRGPLRRIMHFILYYKRRAVVKFGMPFKIQDWLSLQPADAPMATLIQNLRAELLLQLRIERAAITGPGIKPRKWLMEQVLHSDLVQRCVYELAQDLGKPVAKMQDLAARYADEIAADPHHSMIEITARSMMWALRTLYDGITVDEEGLQKVKRAMGAGPVVLVPNHRSHMDYLLISTILYSNNVAVPFIAGGINMNFWPMGSLFRKCGAYFLRRSFSGNPLYKSVFQAYITELVRQQYCQEFFIEGTRSRSGKMAHPKLGMLSMLVESWRSGAATDITFIPVAVTYDQVMEAGSYASELQGARKTAERATDIVKLGGVFKRRWGHVYLRFGDPLSLGLSAAELWPDPAPPHITSDSKAQLVQHMAKAILYAINRETVVTPAAIAAMVLLSQQSGPEDLQTVLDKAKVLIDYLVWKQAPCSPRLTTMPSIRLREAITKLAAAKQVLVHETPAAQTYSADPAHRRQLDYTKNTGVHFFVSVACLARLLLRESSRPEDFEKIIRDYTQMKRLFKYEFNFSTRREIRDHLRHIDDYIRNQPLPLFAGLIDNYVEAYRALFHFIRTAPPAKAPERTWWKTYQSLGQLHHPEALSKSIFQNGLLLLNGLGVITQDKDGEWRCLGINESFIELERLISSSTT